MTSSFTTGRGHSSTSFSAKLRKDFREGDNIWKELFTGEAFKKASRDDRATMIMNRFFQYVRDEKIDLADLKKYGKKLTDAANSESLLKLLSLAKKHNVSKTFKNELDDIALRIVQSDYGKEALKKAGVELRRSLLSTGASKITGAAAKSHLLKAGLIGVAVFVLLNSPKLSEGNVKGVIADSLGVDEMFLDFAMDDKMIFAPHLFLKKCEGKVKLRDGSELWEGKSIKVYSGSDLLNNKKLLGTSRVEGIYPGSRDGVYDVEVNSGNVTDSGIHHRFYLHDVNSIVWLPSFYKPALLFDENAFMLPPESFVDDLPDYDIQLDDDLHRLTR